MGASRDNYSQETNNFTNKGHSLFHRFFALSNLKSIIKLCVSFTVFFSMVSTIRTLGLKFYWWDSCLTEKVSQGFSVNIRQYTYFAKNLESIIFWPNAIGSLWNNGYPTKNRTRFQVCRPCLHVAQRNTRINCVNFIVNCHKTYVSTLKSKYFIQTCLHSLIFVWVCKLTEDWERPKPFSFQNL